MKQNMKEAIGLSLKRYNDTYMKAANDRIDNIVSQAGTDNTEIVDARIDSAGVTHTTLNNRIIAETKMNDQHLVSCSGEYITAENTMGGSITNLEVLGNTIQNEEDLADIKSVGVLQEDGTYKMSILSCGKNLITGELKHSVQDIVYCENVFLNKNVKYTITSKNVDIVNAHISISKNTNPNDSLQRISDFTENIRTFSLNDTLESGYYNLIFWKAGISNTENGFIQLEEGTVATEYEPYQGNKCDILLPCQLEKVGDVSDRLYYDDVEKAWCIEKNVGNVVFNGSEDWVKNTIDTSTTSNVILSLDISNTEKAISDRFIYKQSWCTGEEHFYLDIRSDSKAIVVEILKTRLETDDTNGFKKWLSSNNFTVKYILKTPQKIFLPLDVQIQLNSFFGTTHVYMESGEVEGTIKCKIPKSLGATVQSLNNKTDILSDRIEAIEGLKDSQNMKYETDKGYLVCKETKNGVIDDLKIEGKTLVNLIKSKLVTQTANTNDATEMGKVRLIEGNTYTVIYNLTKASTVGKSSLGYYYETYWLHESTWENLNFSSGVKIYTFEARVSGDVSFRWWTNNSTTDVEVKDFIILEGDHTQNPPSYFEGLMSVGQDVDKIEVLSRKEDGNLIIPLHTGVTTNGYNKNNITFSSDYSMSYVANGWGQGLSVDVVGVVKGETYVILCDTSTNMCIKGANALKTTSDIQMYSNKAEIVATATGIGTITFKNATETGNISCTNLRVIKKGSKEEFSSLKQDKKQILFYNENGELEPIQELHEWDSIEKHSDNKLYYHKRSEKIVLNGSESWNSDSNSSTISPPTYRQSIMFNSINIPNSTFDTNISSNLISDLLPSVRFSNIYNNNHIGISIYGTGNIGTYIVINNGFENATELKQWLQTNNVTVVYQLAEEEVYELAPLHLDSYANETLILCNSGAISPKMEFSITSHINELVKAYGERINLLEEKVYKYMVTQNRMQLASTYSADSVTFKVDYFSLCGDEENYDEDLYNLILNNILVGKDNYDYDKMFTMILDYASWNQISWEQFDILVGLMDIQHNPPVEELPTEDEIEEDIIENEETPVE